MSPAIWLPRRWSRGTALRSRGPSPHHLPMSDSDLLTRGTKMLVFALGLAACGDSKAPPPPPPPPASASASVAAASAECPATGLWAECSVLYRLGRAGLALHVDSGESPHEKALTGKPIVISL